MQDNDIFYLIASATFVVQLVMFVLFLASITSWTFIFSKWRELKKAKISADNFENRFWSGIDLVQLRSELDDEIGMTAVFSAGLSEYERLHKQGGAALQTLSETVVRTMKAVCSREREKHESHLNFLATVGSTSPYVGLLGTVWGIMDAFLALRNMQQATLSLVAPGIAEALIATAMGLFAAIPAVIAYNRFADKADRLGVRYDNFIEEFTAILHKQVFRGSDT